MYCWMVILISRLAGLCHLCEKAACLKTRQGPQIHIGLKRCCSISGSISVPCSYFGFAYSDSVHKGNKLREIKEGLNC